jgi:hypothetical protein
MPLGKSKLPHGIRTVTIDGYESIPIEIKRR